MGIKIIILLALLVTLGLGAWRITENGPTNKLKNDQLRRFDFSRAKTKESSGAS